jgi:hypothetical protein
MSITASTLSLKANWQSEAPIVANRAAGITMTLPASTGNGARFEIIVGTTITSNNLIIQVANSTDVMTGVCLMAQDGGDTIVAFETAASSDTITLNGSTKGGIYGDRIELTDVQAGIWSVRLVLSGTGTEVTPFSAAV